VSAAVAHPLPRSQFKKKKTQQAPKGGMNVRFGISRKFYFGKERHRNEPQATRLYEGTWIYLRNKKFSKPLNAKSILPEI
jgi:hypothetical protein